MVSGTSAILLMLTTPKEDRWRFRRHDGCPFQNHHEMRFQLRDQIRGQLSPAVRQRQMCPSNTHRFLLYSDMILKIKWDKSSTTRGTTRSSKVRVSMAYEIIHPPVLEQTFIAGDDGSRSNEL
jgi:hypothetical protein